MEMKSNWVGWGGQRVITLTNENTLMKSNSVRDTCSVKLWYSDKVVNNDV